MKHKDLPVLFGWLAGFIFLLSIYSSTNAQSTIFRYLDANASTVYLTGEMNGWSDKATPMQQDAPGQWSVSLDLAPGQWLYKFIVDGRFTADPDPEVLSTPDGKGGYYSRKIVGDGDFLYHLQTPHGTVESLNFQSGFLGTGVDLNLYIPPVVSTDSLPVLILLHDSEMDQRQWTDNGMIANFMDNLLARGVIKPFLVVIPSYMPFATNENLPGFFSWDLPTFLKNRYNASMDPKKIVLGGLSFGGWITLKSGANNPDNFGLLMPISTWTPETGKEISKLITLKRVGNINLYCGTQDPLLKNNEFLISYFTNQHIPFTYFKSEGGHTWRYWNSLTPVFLQRVSDFFYLKGN